MKIIHKLSSPRKNSESRNKGNQDRTPPDRDAIAQAAYYRAERRGFAPGGELQDWLEAEHELGWPPARS